MDNSKYTHFLNVIPKIIIVFCILYETGANFDGKRFNISMMDFIELFDVAAQNIKHNCPGVNREDPFNPCVTSKTHYLLEFLLNNNRFKINSDLLELFNSNFYTGIDFIMQDGFYIKHKVQLVVSLCVHILLIIY